MGSSKQTNSIVGNTFSKEERLYHKKIIEELFRNGSSHFSYPFLIKYLPANTDDSVFHRVLISVPKKNFKKAVSRNHLKRRIREVYRTNKHLLYPYVQKIDMAIIYTGKQEIPFKDIKNKLIKVLKRLPVKG